MRRLLLAGLCALALSACSAAQPPQDTPDPAPEPVVTAPAAAPQAGCAPLTLLEKVRDRLADSQTSATLASPETSAAGAMTISGWGPYCARQPTAALCAGGAGRKVTRQEVAEVDAKLRARFEYRYDFTQYGRDDVWASGVTCGDCEDYALTLADDLKRIGAAGASMWLLVWEVYPGGGHATLVVDTQDAGTVEVSVGEGLGVGPVPFDDTKGKRWAALPMDGSGAVALYPGVQAFRSDTEIWLESLTAEPPPVK